MNFRTAAVIAVGIGTGIMYGALGRELAVQSRAKAKIENMNLPANDYVEIRNAISRGGDTWAGAANTLNKGPAAEKTYIASLKAISNSITKSARMAGFR